MTPVSHYWDAYERFQPPLVSLQTIFNQVERGLRYLRRQLPLGTKLSRQWRQSLRANCDHT